jgi:hypothetical protein
MNKWWAAAMTVAVLAVAPAAGASTHSATMDVTFRIQEACAIRSAAAADGQDAQVECQHRTPYRIVQNGAAASSTASNVPRRTERPSDADAPADVTVWF